MSGHAGGDITAGDGTGGESIYDEGNFEDESFVLKHEEAGEKDVKPHELDVKPYKKDAKPHLARVAKDEAPPRSLAQLEVRLGRRILSEV